MVISVLNNSLYKLNLVPFFFPGEVDGNAGDVDEGDENVDLPEGEGTGEEEEEEELDEHGEPIVKEEDKPEEQELTRVAYSEIKGKFPELFKTFPTLREAFFREQRFTEVFPTVEDAQTAADQQAAYLELSDSVLSGDASKLIGEIKNVDDKALMAFSANYMDTLKEVDEKVYYETLTPIVSNLLRNVFDQGTELMKKDEKGGKNVQLAARIIHRELMGKDIDDNRNMKGNDRGMMSDNNDKGKDKKDNEGLNNQQQQKYNTLFGEVKTMTDSSLDAEIIKGLSDIPKGRDGIKQIAVEKIRDLVKKEMGKDAAYVRRMNNLWSREARMGFTGSLKESFKTNFMSKARVLIPKIRVEVRKQLELHSTKDSNKEPNRHGGGSRSSNSSGKRLTPDEIKGKSTRDVLK